MTFTIDGYEFVGVNPEKVLKTNYTVKRDGTLIGLLTLSRSGVHLSLHSPHTKSLAPPQTTIDKLTTELLVEAKRRKG